MSMKAKTVSVSRSFILKNQWLITILVEAKVRERHTRGSHLNVSQELDSGCVALTLNDLAEDTAAHQLTYKEIY